MIIYAIYTAVSNALSYSTRSIATFLFALAFFSLSSPLTSYTFFDFYAQPNESYLHMENGYPFVFV